MARDRSGNVGRGCLRCLAVVVIGVLLLAFFAPEMSEERRRELEERRDMGKAAGEVVEERAAGEVVEEEAEKKKSTGLTESSAAYAGRQGATKLLESALRAPTTAKYPQETVRAVRMRPIVEEGKTFERWRVFGLLMLSEREQGNRCRFGDS